MAAKKKTASKKSEFKANDFVVYPAHGVGKITGIEKQEVAGHKLELIVINFEKEKMTLRVPVAKVQSVGMRRLANDDVVGQAIKTELFSTWPIVATWALGGLALLWPRLTATSSTRPLEELTVGAAAMIGAAQVLALWPGTSRSLVTIIAALAVGLSLSAAVEFSFLLGVITLLAATCYKALKAGPVMVEAYGWTPMLIGSIAAWLSAVLAVKWMVSYLKKHGMAIFGYYRVALAVIVGGAIVAGMFNPPPVTTLGSEEPPTARLTGEIE